MSAEVARHEECKVSPIWKSKKLERAAFTTSVNSRTDYSDESTESTSEETVSINTVIHQPNSYGEDDLIARPTISTDTVFDPLSTLMLSSDETVGHFKNFFKAISSNVIMDRTEDWGIDRSIYTRYSRCGFFGECACADALHHDQYLDNPGMQLFAELRMPLVFCIIFASRAARPNEVQKGIVPLAVNLLDRYLCSFKLDPEDTFSIATRIIDQEWTITPLSNAVIYNIIAAACYFISDRYNGINNTSVTVLLLQWEAACRLFTKTVDAGKFIYENRTGAYKLLHAYMFHIYNRLDYKLTVPFPCFMVQCLIVASEDLPYSQNPSCYNIYQIFGFIFTRIALVDDTFHRYKSSTISLATYALVRRLALVDKVIEENAKTWLTVDETDSQVHNCIVDLVETLVQHVDTDVLDALVQPVNVLNRREDIFTFMFDELNTVDINQVASIATTLYNIYVAK